MIEIRLANYIRVMLGLIVICLLVFHFLFLESISIVLYVLAMIPMSLVVQILFYQRTENRRTAFFALLTLMGLITSMILGGGNG